MRINKGGLIGGAMAAVLLAGGVYLAGPSEAAIPPVVPGNITVLPNAPRVVPSPGTAFLAGETKVFEIGGKTFGGFAIPANTTGVTLSVTATNPAATGKLTVWPVDAGKPGSPTVSYTAGVAATNVAFVGLNDAGKLQVNSTAKTNVVMSIVGYVTPETAPAAPTIRSIAAKDATTLTGVGGSIRTKSTTFGSIELPAGTWDARVAGGWTGLNNANKACTPDGTFLTGSMVLVKGDNTPFEFADVVATAGGVLIPESNSASLTQDPTANISTIFTLTAPTIVTVRLFAYASDSSTACEGTLKGNLQGAQFLKVA